MKKTIFTLAFHITKDYGSVGYPGGYPGGYPYGTHPGIGIGSIYPGTLHRGSSLIPGYRGYPGGPLGGGQLG